MTGTFTRSASLFNDQNGDGSAYPGATLLTHILNFGPSSAGFVSEPGGGTLSAGGLAPDSVLQTTGLAADAPGMSLANPFAADLPGIVPANPIVDAPSTGIVLNTGSQTINLVPDNGASGVIMTIGTPASSLATAGFDAAAFGAAGVDLGKLQNGLGEIYMESQAQVVSLTGAALTAALDNFHSVNSAAEISGGMIAIDAVATNGNGAALLAQLEALGLQSGASYGAMAGGFIPLAALGSVSDASLLAFARPVYAVTESAGAGSVVSQDVQAVHADTVQTVNGLTGAGVTIGILSDSFNTSTSTTDHYANDVTSGDLPAGITIVKDDPVAATDEGRGMAQVAYDIAPGANFDFYTGNVSMADFANGIVALSTLGAKIIVDDLRYFAEPMFQDGILAQAEETAYANGAMTFSSAGNYGALSYDSVFRDSGQTITVGAVTYELHDFDPGVGVDTMQAVRQVGAVNYILQWDQPFFSLGGAGASSDLALFFFDHNTHAFLGSVDSTHVGGDPLEIAGLNSGSSLASLDIAIGVRQGTPLPNEIKYAMIGGSSVIDEFATDSATMFGHANSEHTIAVGAADWFNTPAFGQTPPLGEWFTSKGGQAILFDDAGNRLATPELREGVAFTAADGGNTTFFGSDVAGDADTSPNFYGTSAAAPNAAAVAALIMQGHPNESRTEIANAMKGSGIDIGNLADNVNSHTPDVVTGAGPDAFTGTGLIQADNALNSVTASRSTSISNDQNGDGHANPGDTLVTHIDILNGTASDITSVAVTDPSNGSTIIAGSVLVSHDDVFSLVGNTPISFTAAQGLLSNDFNGDGVNLGNNTGLTVTSVTESDGHGSVTFNADGSFTFTPTTGYTGDATFTYTVTDAAGTVGTAHATLHIVGEVWYVDPGASAAGADGSFLHPFTDLTHVNAAGGVGDADGANDSIVVHGSVTGSLPLEAGQTVYGDGSSFMVNGHQVTNSVGTTTIANSSGAVITLSTDNTVDGVTVNANGAGVVGMQDGGGSVSSTTSSAGLNLVHDSFTGAGEALEVTHGGKITGTIDSLTSSGSSGAGVRLAGTAGSGTGLLSGSLTISAGAVSGSAGTGFQIGNGTASSGGTITVDDKGTIDKSSAGTAIDVNNHSTNTVQFEGNIGAAHNAGAINVSGNTGDTVNFSGATVSVSTGVSNAVNLTGNAGAAINFTGGGLAIGTTSGTGLTFTGGGQLTITGSGNSIATTTGQIATLQSGAVGASGITFASMGASGTVANHGVYVHGLTGGTFSGGTVTVTGTSGTGNDATASDGIHIDGASTATFSFGTTTIGDTTHSVAGDGIDISGPTTGAVTVASATINNVGGDGMVITNAGHAVTVSGGAIGGTNDPAGIDLHVVGGTGAVTMAAALTKTTAGHVVDITGHGTGAIGISGNISATGGVDNGISITSGTSGTTTFSGTVTETVGGGAAVNIGSNSGGSVVFSGTSQSLTTTSTNAFNMVNNSGGSVTFSAGTHSFTATSGTALNFTNTGTTGAALSFTGGSLAVSTTSGTGINAVDSNAAAATSPIGSLTISGATNTVSSTGGGTGVNIDGVAETVTLKSVNFAGGSNTAIFLQNAGNGGFTVTGTGTTAASGGTINHAAGGANQSHTAGDGIYLNNVGNISLSNLTLEGAFSNYGIHGNNVTNFNLDHSSLTGIYGDSTALGTADEESAVAFDNLLGTATITNSTLGGTSESDDLRVTNTSGTLTRLTADTDTFGTISINGNHAVNLSVTNTATANFTVTNSTVTNYIGSGINVTANADSTSDVVIRSNNVSNSNVNASAGANGIKIAGDTAGHTTHVTYDVSHNTIMGSVGDAILVAKGNGKGIWSGTINANTIGNAGVAKSGSSEGSGIFTESNGTGSNTVLISNNQIHQTNQTGISVWANDSQHGVNGATPGVFNASVFGNTTDTPASFQFAGLDVEAGAASGDDNIINIVVGSATDATKKNDFSAGDPTNNTDVIFSQEFNALVHLSQNGSAATGSSTASIAQVIHDDNLNSANTLVAVAANTAADVSIVSTLPTLPAVVAAVLVPHAPLPDTIVGEKPVDDPVVTVTGPDGTQTPPADTPAPSETPPPPIDAHTPSTPVADVGILTQAELSVMVDAAIARWAAAGATPEQIAAMKATTVSISSIAGLDVGDSTPGHIAIDADGAGYGWFLDATPNADGEFHGSGTDLAANAGGPADGHLDLLTVLMHELGHQVGLLDDYKTADSADIMYGYVNPGERRLPSSADVAHATGTPVDHESFALSPVDAGTIPAGQGAEVSFQSTVDPYGPGLVPTYTNTSHITYTGNAIGIDSNTETLSPTSTPALASLTLGDTVYNDANANGTYDAGEGVSGVALTLFAKGTASTNYTGAQDVDVDGDGFVDKFVSTITSGVNGGYDFTGLGEGKYIVQVDASNFLAGHALAGLTVLPTAANSDNNVDNDNNAHQVSGGGIVSNPITLNFDQEGPGFNGTAGDNTNNTLDLGFVANLPPTANPDFVTVDEDSGANDLTTQLLSIDTDPDNDALTITSATAASHGTVTVTSGTLTYTPGADYNGSDSFSYTINDGHGHTATSTATVTVNAVNDPVTTGAPATLTVDEDVSAPVPSLSISDVDATLAPSGVYEVTLSALQGTLTLTTTTGLTFTGGSDGTADASMTFHGTLADINAALATARYVGNANYNGSDTIHFTATDQFGATVATGSGAATSSSSDIAITVNSVNDVPATADHTVTATEDTAYVFQASDFPFSDPNDSPANALAAVKIVSVPGAGMLTDNGVAVGAGDSVSVADITAGKLVFTPAADANGSAYASFQFEVQDDGGTASNGHDTSSAATMTIDVTAVNDAPVATDDGYSTNEDNPLSVNAASGVLANDTDIDTAHTSLTASLVAGPSHASSFTLHADGSFDYTPAANFNGTDTFTYKVNDGSLDGNIATVTITVDPINDGPVLSTSSPVTETEQTAVTLNSGLTVSDVDLDALNGGNGDYAGATFIINRATPNAEDTFAFNLTGASFTVSGNNLQVGGQTFATLTQAGGVFDISFTSTGTIATTALVNEVLQHLQYTNTSDTPPASVTLLYGFDDGAPGHGQGTVVGSNNLTAHSVTVNITAVNDAPVNHVPAGQTSDEDTSITFSSGGGNAITVSDV
ncbi:MAG TPA: tandem-95 repeat protein, partial [Allosphingosinicella sp.]|nr:tandem-95 repeat protein [Allosphingosinicella sp.]